MMNASASNIRFERIISSLNLEISEWDKERILSIFNGFKLGQVYIPKMKRLYGKGMPPVCSAGAILAFERSAEAARRPAPRIGEAPRRSGGARTEPSDSLAPAERGRRPKELDFSLFPQYFRITSTPGSEGTGTLR